MTEPRWRSPVHLLSIHADQIQAQGAPSVSGTEACFYPPGPHPESASVRVDVELACLAAASALGISGNHPFVDGNKRVAFPAMYILPVLTGFSLEVPEQNVVAPILAPASGQLEESARAGGPVLADAQEHASVRHDPDRTCLQEWEQEVGGTSMLNDPSVHDSVDVHPGKDQRPSRRLDPDPITLVSAPGGDDTRHPFALGNLPVDHDAKVRIDFTHSADVIHHSLDSARDSRLPIDLDAVR